MIKIIIPASTIHEAISIRDRVRGIVVQEDEQCYISDGGVTIVTPDPVRVCLELQAEGFY